MYESWFLDQDMHQNIIGTKWAFCNKMNEDGIIVRNEARLVCKGYSQEENFDFDKYLHPLQDRKLLCFFLPISHSNTFYFIKGMPRVLS